MLCLWKIKTTGYVKEVEMKQKYLVALGLFTFLAFFVLTNSAWCGDFPVISAKELEAKMDAGEQMLVLNPLSDIEFNEGNIPGSVNIPLHTIATTNKLPQDKGTLIVTYCLGPK